jgi:putative pyruvate formate lyase activating enzyme
MIVVSASARHRFVVNDFKPAYRRPEVLPTLAQRAREAQSVLASCVACPRACEADRTADQVGFCETGRYARVTSAFAHFGEERCLVGDNGSGTIFFALCNLKCVFCQNADISHFPSGQLLNADALADVMLELQSIGCHNINFVSPSHVVSQVIEAVATAAPKGLNVPIVYNTNAYDSVDTLRRLDGIVDIYMPDFKFWSPETSQRLCMAPDYPQRAREAILEMHRQTGDLCWDPGGVAKRGLLVRHLVMPGMVDDSAAIFRWLATGVSRDTFVNIMGQYHPSHRVGRRVSHGADAGSVAYAEINRRPGPDELQHAFELARQAGLWRFDR